MTIRRFNFIPAPYRLAAGLAAGAVALVLAFVLLGRLGVSWDPFGWSAARHEQDRAGSIAGKGQTAASDAALKATDDFTKRQADRAALEQETRDDILAQPDAGADAGDAGLAGLRGLCRRPEYSGSARCLQLRGQGSAPAAR